MVGQKADRFELMIVEQVGLIDDEHGVSAAFGVFVLLLATAMLYLKLITGEGWVSTATWTLTVVVLGLPAGVLATGWTAQAVVKASKSP